jgi:hypothetical protein
MLLISLIDNDRFNLWKRANKFFKSKLHYMKKSLFLIAISASCLFISSCKKDTSNDGNNLAITIQAPSSGFVYTNKFAIYVSSVSTGVTVATGFATNGDTYAVNVNPGDYYIQIATDETGGNFSMNNADWTCKDVGECGLTVQATTQRKAVTVSKWCQYQTGTGLKCN